MRLFILMAGLLIASNASAVIKTANWSATAAPCVRLVVKSGSQTANYRYCTGQTSARVSIPRRGGTVSLLSCDARGRNCQSCSAPVVVK